MSALDTEALAKLRQPFPDHQISKLPKPTKAQTDAVKADYKKGVRCKVCGTWHHPDVVHLDYVGHAALTDRLLDADPAWSWEPAAVTPEGLPAFDRTGGLWIRLTVAGVTRLGYGSADGKTGGDAIKEIIGDALRNAGMRFGAALDLWHKGDLHLEEEAAAALTVAPTHFSGERLITDEQRHQLMMLAEYAGVDAVTLCAKCKIPALPALPAAKYESVRKWLESKLDKSTPPPAAAKAAPSDILEDEVPF